MIFDPLQILPKKQIVFLPRFDISFKDLDRSVNILKMFREKGYSIICAFCYVGSEVNDEKVKGKLQEYDVYNEIRFVSYRGTISEIIDHISSSEFVLSDRLHGLIPASLAGAKLLTNERSDKILSYLNEYCVECKQKDIPHEGWFEHDEKNVSKYNVKFSIEMGFSIENDSTFTR